MTDHIQPQPYQLPAWVTDNPEAAASSFWQQRAAEYAETDATRGHDIREAHRGHRMMSLSKCRTACRECYEARTRKG